MTIDLVKNANKLFTKVFYKVREAQRSLKRFFVNYGGAGSSKSVSQHQNELINLLTCNYDILIMRKVGADIYDSCYKLLQNIATEWGIYDRFEWTYSQSKRQIFNPKTGHRILFRGADDINKLKSIVGIGRIILEEADAFEFDDFKEINRRARGFENIQIVFILNPVDEEHWIKTMFVDRKDETGKNPKQGIYNDRTFISKSTYSDNQFMTDEDKAELERLKNVDENDYNIYVLAKWGRLKTGSEFYPNFKETVHAGKFPFVPGNAIHISYDFNVVPYMTLLCFQYLETQTEIIIRLYKEYCLESPLNTTEAISNVFLDDHEKYITDLFFYGDASGNNRIAGKGDEVNYDDVRTVLFKYIEPGSDRTAKANKPVLKRRKLVMKALAGELYYGHKKVIIQIDEDCQHTINDFKYLKLGKDGKLKELVEQPKTKVKYQKYGHCTDAFEYFFCELFSELL